VKVKGNANSMGNYITLKTNLEGYQTQTGKALTFERMNTKIFMPDFHNYIATTKINAKNKTKVYLKTSSVKEKISKLKSFYNWLSDEDIYTIKPSNMKVKIAKIHNEPQSLTKDDLRQLQGLANCLMGMRFSDLQLTTKANIMQHHTGQYYIRQIMKKTTSPAQIELLPLSLTILEKYNFSFPKMCLLTFNSHLHTILKEHNLFSEPITRQEHRNNEPQDVTTPRRELITSHSMRRTFVNLCLQNNVPINTIMLATSHKHVKTLESYIQRLPNPQAFAGIAI
jgi:integrase